LRKTLLAVSFFLGTAAWAAPYQKIKAEIPSYLPPGVKDSVLIVWGPPIAELPNQSIDSGESPVVWVKVKVGAKGRAVDVWAIYSSVQDSGKIKSALKAAKLGLYYAAWNGPYTVEYEGYYPVTFASPHYAEFSPNQPRALVYSGGAMSIPGLGPIVFGPVRSKDWKELEQYVGRNAPYIEPTNPYEAVRPDIMLDSMAEPTVWLRVHVNREGRVSASKPFFFLQDVSAFDKAAAQAVRQASFPIKKIGDKVLEYEAYVAVPFRHLPGAFWKHGYPEPDEKPTLDEPPRTIEQTTIEMPPILSRSGIEGTVGLRMLVDDRGNAMTVRVDSSSGFLELDRLAEVRAQKMYFSPAVQSGKLVSAWATTHLQFVAALPKADSAVSQQNQPSPTDSIKVEIDSEASMLTPGEFVALEVQPEMIKEVKPKFPLTAKMAGTVGKVWVMALVDKNGIVREARVAKTSRHADLDSAAVSAARKCLYKPGIQNGKPVSVWVTYPVEFSIGR
jgi:protein TonB